MKSDPLALELVLLAPELGGSPDATLGYAAQLADILNTDKMLPQEIKRRPGTPLETAESVLLFTKDWCLKKNAISYAVVVGHDVAGSISLSHMDVETGHAQTGYFIASRFQNRGIGTRALSRLLDIARERGVRKITASTPRTNVASRRIWEKCGVPVEFTNDTVTAVLDGDYSP